MKHVFLRLSVSLFCFFYLTAISADTCLEKIRDLSHLGKVYVDNIYYPLRDEQANQFDDWRKIFSQQTLDTLQEPLAEQLSCEPFPVSAEDFSCTDIAQTEICSANTNVTGLSVTIVKDYVDSANVVVLDSTKNPVSGLPTIDIALDDTALYLPAPELCYETLLDTGEGLSDSSSYTLNVSAFKNFQDLRFVMARALRDLVREKAQVFPDICEYQTVTRETKDMRCDVLNASIETCVIDNLNGGFFVLIAERLSGNLGAVFNRWD
ncbi:MAG: hypothetical protein AAGB12_12920 [Pseudomonadota bacterium]